MKKITLLGIIFLLYSCISGNCEDQIPLVKDVRGEVSGDNAQIIVETNCDVPYLDYVLPNPTRLIIDPIGRVYSDLKDVITFDSGPVKKVEVVKGKSSEEAIGNFYPLDFISIELSASPEYKIRKETKGELIVDIEKKKAREVQIPKLSPALRDVLTEQEAVEPLPLQEAPQVETPPPQEMVTALPAIKIEQPKKAPVPAVTMGQPGKAAIPETREVIPLAEVKEEAAPVVSEPIKLIYTIGEGDVLDISVWQHPELDKKVVVRPDGYISFPLAGDAKAIGLPPTQLASSIKENLSRLIRDPQVTVIVSSFGSKNIFVLGEVTKPGSYPFRGGISILDAISEAGGWKNSAVLNSVMVVRKAFTDSPEAHRLDVYALIKKGDFSQNLSLEQGDIIYVPKSFVANIGGFIENLKVSVGAYVTEGTHIFD